jgi:hypothetical protein
MLLERTVRSSMLLYQVDRLCSIILFSWKRGALFSDFIYLEIFKIHYNFIPMRNRPIIIAIPIILLGWYIMDNWVLYICRR